MSSIFTSVLTSAGLGAGAGLNAYATMLVFGLLARLRPQVFTGELAHFFASTPVLTIVAVLYIVEFVADKIPAVDHVWDIIHTLIRPAAGAVVAWAAVSKGGIPHGAVIMASVIAGTAVLGMHGAKATTRAASTLMTGGLGNPVLSLIEDVLAFGGALAALLVPLLVLVMLLLMALFFVVVSRRRRVPA